jgi:RimJ/RimL family protein N-acetyltransferase
MKKSDAGKRLVAALKATAMSGMPSLVLQVDHPVGAVLRPIPTVEGHLDTLDVDLLTVWRNRHVKSFLTEFIATRDRTATWLTQHVHANEGKLLFMVETPDGNRVGHIGLGFVDWTTGYGEADAIVSGGASPKGLMKASLLVLMQWSRDVLGLNNLAVRVRSANPALEFYRRVGFQEVKRVPIVAHTVVDGTHWTESPQSDDRSVTLVHMRLVFPK